MRSSVLLAAIVPFTLAAPHALVSRTAKGAQRIIDAVSIIETRIATLTTSLNNFNQGDLTSILQVLNIEQQTTQLGAAVQNATKVARNIRPLSESESGTVAIAVLQLQSDITPLLDLIVAKKPVFDQAVLGLGSVSPQVRQDLVQQKAYANAFGVALTKKLAGLYAQAAPVVIAQINEAFDNATAAYNTTGGTFALPPLPSFAAFKAEMAKYQDGGPLSGIGGL